MSQEKLTVNVLSTHLSANEIISTFDNQAIDEDFVSNTFNGIFDLPINLETTPLFKDYVAKVKKQLVKTKRQGRLQVARKSTNLIAVDIKQQKDQDIKSEEKEKLKRKLSFDNTEHKKEDSDKETKEEKEKDLSKPSCKATSDSIEAATLSPPETETTDSASIVPCEGVVDIEQQKDQDIKSEEKEKSKRKLSFDNTEHKKEDSDKETKEEKEKDLSKPSSKATSNSIEAATLSPPETETTDSASIVPCEGVVDIEQQKDQDIKSEEKEKLKRKLSFDNTEHVSREKTIRNCSPPPESIKEEDKPC